MNAHRFLFVVTANALGLCGQFVQFLFKGLLRVSYRRLRLSTRPRRRRLRLFTRFRYFLQALLPCGVGFLSSCHRVRICALLEKVKNSECAARDQPENE